MEFHDPSPDELEKMDDLLLDIKRYSFDLQICILDPHNLEDKKNHLEWIQAERKNLIDELKKLVWKWSYIPVCAGSYLPKIPITLIDDSPGELKKMDDIITKIQHNFLYLQIYKHEKKHDEKRIAEIEDTAMKRINLIGELRALVENWPYVPLCAQNLLEVTHFVDVPL